jgi:hypothetical protein
MYIINLMDMLVWKDTDQKAKQKNIKLIDVKAKYLECCQEQDVSLLSLKI